VAGVAAGLTEKPTIQRRERSRGSDREGASATRMSPSERSATFGERNHPLRGLVSSRGSI